jgi:anion-transporting  ArsA/GET3 family ATPase
VTADASSSSTTGRENDWPDVELHVVSGKGGTGKTTVAAALALALASRGKHVLLCEVEGRQGIAQLFDVPPLPYEERRLAQGLDDGGDVYALAIDAESAMLEYIQLYYRMGARTGRLLDRFGVLDFATTIAPGLRDVLLTGKVYEAVVRNSRNKGARQYDAVVLDAPPTGRIAQFLNVNGEFGELAKVGMVKGQTERVMGLLKSRRTAVHLVTVLEDMPVQETADGIVELGRHGLPVGGIVVNLTRPDELDPEARRRALEGELSADDIAKDLADADCVVSPELAEGLVEEGHDYAERRDLEDRQRARIAELGVGSYELRRLPDGIDLGGLYELADDLREQGMA